jgi:hypothetical protein
LTPDAVGLLELYPFLEGNYFNNTVCYNILVIIIVKYIILLLPCIRRWLCKAGFFLLDTPSTHDAFGLLESSPFLEGYYFNKWILY